MNISLLQELYEPLWDELYDRLNSKGIHIGNIFIADVAHQGQSGVLNEERLGNDRQSSISVLPRKHPFNLSQRHGSTIPEISS